MERFRSLPVKSNQLQVDREKRVIYGVSAAQAVEALGHGVMLDEKSLDQLVSMGNAAKRGIKSRFTHPGMSADGLGKYLGRLRDFRREDDKAIADLHLSELASKSPSGDLGAYVMDMATNEPDMFGMSVVIDLDRVWRLADGSEWTDTDSESKPNNALDQLPVARIKQFVACDAVDEPAANRDGLFSSALWHTNQDAEQAFAQLDDVLQEWGVSTEKAYDVALKYFNARGVKVQRGVKMEDNKTAEQLATLQAQLNAMQEQLAAKEAAEAEAKARAEQVTAALDASNARIAKMEADARQVRFRALAAGWTGETEGHVELLTQLADAAGEDSKAFRFYVEQQNAVAAQLSESKLFEEVGTSRPADNDASAVAKVNRLASAKAKDAGVALGTAMQQVFSEQPDLYRAYVAETETKVGK